MSTKFEPKRDLRRRAGEKKEVPSSFNTLKPKHDTKGLAGDPAKEPPKPVVAWWLEGRKEGRGGARLDRSFQKFVIISVELAVCNHGLSLVMRGSIVFSPLRRTWV